MTNHHVEITDGLTDTVEHRPRLRRTGPVVPTSPTGEMKGAGALSNRHQRHPLSTARKGKYRCLAVLPALAAAACGHHDSWPHQGFPDCQTIVRAIPANVLVQPQLRFKPLNDAEATDEPPSSALCAILSLARDRKAQLKVQIWLDSADVLATSGVRNRAEVLGEAAESETAGFCQEDPVTSGNPITRTTCYTTTLDGSIAGAAVVHGSAVIAVRIDAKPNGQTKDEFQQFLQDQASSVADAVVAAI